MSSGFLSQNTNKVAALILVVASHSTLMFNQNATASLIIKRYVTLSEKTDHFQFFFKI